MKKHWIYFKYILRHKWYCLKGCWKLAPSWLWEVWLLGLFHDWSKFRPSEWVSYAEHFYGDGRSNDEAWLNHIHRNKHHWQHWTLREDSGEVKCLKIPDKYILEMVADWYAAGMAITGRPLISSWYEKNKEKMLINKSTRETLEAIIENFEKRNHERETNHLLN